MSYRDRRASRHKRDDEVLLFDLLDELVVLRAERDAIAPPEARRRLAEGFIAWALARGVATR